MITKVYPDSGTLNKVTLDDGNSYIFKPLKYENIAGYAPIIIIHENTGKSYESYGYLELHGHTFTSKWNERFFSYDEGYTSSKEFTVDIE